MVPPVVVYLQFFIFVEYIKVKWFTEICHQTSVKIFYNYRDSEPAQQSVRIIFGGRSIW